MWHVYGVYDGACVELRYQLFNQRNLSKIPPPGAFRANENSCKQMELLWTTIAFMLTYGFFINTRGSIALFTLSLVDFL
jgi:hypothetical protein